MRFRPGISLHEQVVYAAKKAIISGRMRTGDPFPSVRNLSKELKINPNTAHKVVARLVSDGLLEAQPGIGTVVAALPEATAADRAQLLGYDIEELVVEAKKLGLSLESIVVAVSEHWKRLESDSAQAAARGSGGRSKR